MSSTHDRHPTVVARLVVLLATLAAGLVVGPRPAAAGPVPTTVSLAVSANPALAGQSVTLIAEVRAAAGTPGGSVTFTDGAAVLGRAPRFFGRYALNVRLGAGVHLIAASFDGDATFGPGSASTPTRVAVAPTSIATTSSANPSLVGQRVLLTAQVSPVAPASGTPAGTVTFLDGTTVLGTAGLVWGQFAIGASFATAGTHLVTARYSGDASLGPSTATFSQAVSSGTQLLVATPTRNPAPPGPVTIDVAPATSVAGGPAATGAVTISDGTTVLATVALGSTGRARATLPAASAGDHLLVASYPGDGVFAASTASAVQQVRTPTSLTLRSSPATPVHREAVVLSAVVAPAGADPATGSVTFTDGATVLGTATRQPGTTDTFALAVPAGLAAGGHVLVASWSGTATRRAAAAGVALDVAPAATTTALTVSPARAPADQPVVLRATVAPTAPGGGLPTGTVVFRDGETVLGSAAYWYGSFAITLAHPAIGDHTVVATYLPSLTGAVGEAGPTHLGSSSGPAALTVDPVLWLPEPPRTLPAGTTLPTPIKPFGGTGPRVAVLGDSITYNLNFDFRFDTRLQAAGYASSITALPGYEAATFKPYADQYVAVAPAVVVINLGTNDAVAQAKGFADFSPDLYAQRIDALAALFPSACVVVTTITTNRTYTLAGSGYTAPAFDDAARTYDDHLRSTYAHVADWDALVAQHPDYLPDEVHPTNDPVAVDALLDLMVGAVQTCG